jgi:hypothetical protein
MTIKTFPNILIPVYLMTMMVNNFTNINKMNNHHKSLNIKNTTTYDAENIGLFGV